jgi:hypothetical protein
VGRRQQRSLLQAAEEGIAIAYTVKVNYGSMGYSSDGAAYSALTTELFDAVISGNFTRLLRQNGSPYGILSSAYSTNVDIAPNTVPAYPTPAPISSFTKAPSSGTTSSSGSATAAIASGVIGSLIFIVVCAGFAYYVVQRRSHDVWAGTPTQASAVPISVYPPSGHSNSEYNSTYESPIVTPYRTQDDSNQPGVIVVVASPIQTSN